MTDRLSDWGARLQATCEAHLMACMEAEDTGTGSPASAPFCSCLTCIVREVLGVAYAAVVAEANKLPGVCHRCLTAVLEPNGDCLFCRMGEQLRAERAVSHELRRRIHTAGSEG